MKTNHLVDELKDLLHDLETEVLIYERGMNTILLEAQHRAERVTHFLEAWKAVQQKITSVRQQLSQLGRTAK